MPYISDLVLNRPLSSFETIYAVNYTKLFRVAVKMLGDKDNAADVVQEVFINLYDKLNKEIVILHMNSWLYRTTLNKCIDHHRYHKRFQKIETINEVLAMETSIEANDASIAVKQVISILKPREKAIVVLYSEGLSYKEIAAASGIRFSSVGTTLSRALKKLGQELKNQKYELY